MTRIVRQQTPIQVQGSHQADLRKLKGDSGGPWIEVSGVDGPGFLNGWEDAGGDEANVGFYVKGGHVRFRGVAASGTYGTVAFVLPEGFRPSKTIRIPAALTTADGLCPVQVDPDGSFTILDPISGGTGATGPAGPAGATGPAGSFPTTNGVLTVSPTTTLSIGAGLTLTEPVAGTAAVALTDVHGYELFGSASAFSGLTIGSSRVESIAKVSGVSYLDLSTPSVPTFVTAGYYAIHAMFGSNSSGTYVAGSELQGIITAHGSHVVKNSQTIGPGATTFSFEVVYVGYFTAGDPITFTIVNRTNTALIGIGVSQSYICRIG